MTVRVHTGRVLGKLQGFVIDEVAQQLKFLVVQTSGLLRRTRLLQFDMARLDATHHAIEVLGEEPELQKSGFFPAF